MFIIKSQNSRFEHEKFSFLESHCCALVWKHGIENAKNFKTKREANSTIKRWNISNGIVEKI